MNAIALLRPVDVMHRLRALGLADDGKQKYRRHKNVTHRLHQLASHARWPDDFVLNTDIAQWDHMPEMSTCPHAPVRFRPTAAGEGAMMAATVEEFLEEPRTLSPGST